MVKSIYKFSIVLLTLFISSCNKDKIGPQYDKGSDKIEGSSGFWIINEGNYNWGNTSISFYDADRKQISNLVYKAKQETPIGDVLQSMYFNDDSRFLIINNSHQIKMCSKEMDLINNFNGFNSPRYMEHLSGSEFLVTSLEAKQIYKLNINTKEIQTFLTVNDWTEKIIRLNDMFIIEHKSFSDINPADQQIFKVDTNGQMIKTLDILNPHSELTKINDSKFCFISQDESNSKLWISDIDFNVQTFNIPEKVSQISYSNNFIYLAGENLWQFNMATSEFKTLRSLKNKTIYGLSSSDDGYIYISDAKDYVSSGDFLIYSTETNTLIDSVKTSIIPSEIYFEK